MRQLLFFASILILLSGCGKEFVFNEVREIKNHTWNVEDKLNFEFPVTDTLSPHNLFITVRHRGDYEYSNLYMFITTFRPDGKKSRDTVDCILQNPQGKWLGKGIGDIYDNKLVFHLGARFPVSGVYRFEFEQAMRKESVENITDVGLSVEKTGPR